MTLYRLTQERLEPLAQTTLELERIRERTDLQRILRDQPDVLEEGLFIVSEEFSNWENSSLRIDLLGLGGDGRLVVVELKRDERGGAMELQALRYAAMASNMTLEQVVSSHSAYLALRGIDADARERVMDHLGATDLEAPEIHSERPRIILASGNFSRELTTSVLWLNQMGLEITCLRLRLYKVDEDLLLDVNQVIPLPEAEHYLVQVREKASEAEKQRATSGTLSVGSEAFKESVRNVADQFQPTLEKYHNWAVSLEEEGLVRLFTFQGAGGVTTLLPRIPGEHAGLVTLYNSPGGPYIQVWRSVFERRAPKSIEPIEAIIGEGRLGQGASVRLATDDLFERLRAAYRETASDAVRSDAVEC